MPLYFTVGNENKARVRQKTWLFYNFASNAGRSPFREEHRFRVFKNKVQRRISEPEIDGVGVFYRNLGEIKMTFIICTSQ
jgi:hypothetical protein